MQSLLEDTFCVSKNTQTLVFLVRTIFKYASRLWSCYLCRIQQNPHQNLNSLFSTKLSRIVFGFLLQNFQLLTFPYSVKLSLYLSLINFTIHKATYILIQFSSLFRTTFFQSPNFSIATPSFLLFPKVVFPFLLKSCGLD